LRRHGEENTASAFDAEKILATKDLKISPERHEVFVRDRKVDLTMTEFAILTMLVRRPGWAFSRQQIIDNVRGHDYMVTPRMIDVQIFSLRKKLGETGPSIETVRGIGYRFKD
jgi:two-component system phosphate regulon response regulator PhoB